MGPRRSPSVCAPHRRQILNTFRIDFDNHHGSILFETGDDVRLLSLQAGDVVGFRLEYLDVEGDGGDYNFPQDGNSS